jgi:hypothetical protein
MVSTMCQLNRYRRLLPKSPSSYEVLFAVPSSHYSTPLSNVPNLPTRSLCGIL